MNTELVILCYAGAILTGYLFGNINTAAILAKLKGFDIRKKGSGNAGASNAYLTMGKSAATFSAIVDIFKAFIPVWFTLHILHLPDELRHIPVVTGFSVIIGHIFPFWMKFRGGKGFASLLGMNLALNWKFFFFCVGILAVIMLFTRYIALATVCCAIALPIWWFSRTGDVPETVLFSLVTVIVIWKHIPNFKRIMSGTELIPASPVNSEKEQESA
ncbi:MAG: glycerol-3-phosphate 1-O-acyltransferase PlsY [Oscillospiraceae bacterium]|nr:glycerol-3-phosphate 1-O-acyltransferase PlsY [Oscillospiraceae bacterium]